MVDETLLGKNAVVFREGGTVGILLTQGKTAFVDFTDWLVIRHYRWCAQRWRNTFYAGTSLNGKFVRLHRFLLPDPPMVDHRDGDGLNNCRHNLRSSTASENGFNSRKRLGTHSRFHGVTWHRANGKWMAQITVEKEHRYLGCFDTEEAAHRARLAAEQLYYPEFKRETVNV